ncbi:MAG: hypothetical protein RRC07_07305, partial [Anaerolineae bacterium]|nr:hypothetical protein [Anaerolineae bacterium]
RQYAWERLSREPAQLAEVETRHADYYLALLRAASEQLDGSEALAAQEAITQEMDNVRAAWRQAAQRPHPGLLLQSLDSLVCYYQHIGRSRDCLSLLHEIYELLPTPTRASQAPGRLLAARARLLALTGRFDEGLQVAEAALGQ